MQLSLLYPIYNRTGLFRQTCESLIEQTLDPSQWEMVVIDDGGKDPDLLPMLQEYARTYGWNVQYHYLDTTQHPHRKYELPNGAKNPCVAWNTAIKLARGERVVLTSPEIIQRKPTNLEACVEWYLPKRTAFIADVWDEEYKDNLDINGWISGGPKFRPLAFFETVYRDDLLVIGGFEEKFLGGYAWEDIEFTYRWERGGTYEFGNGAVVCEHLWHPRPLTKYNTWDAEIWNRYLWQKVMWPAQSAVANIDHEWGSSQWVQHSWVSG